MQTLLGQAHFAQKVPIWTQIKCFAQGHKEGAKKVFFFVQQVQSFPFQKIMAAPGYRKFSAGGQEALAT